MTPEQFRAEYPEFADADRFGVTLIERQLRIAAARLNADRWADLLDDGIGLFVAHHVALQGRQVATANAGGMPGAPVAAVASKTVGPVSTSYDSSSVSLTNAGHWNGTTYGTQFYELMRMVGAGGLQL